MPPFHHTGLAITLRGKVIPTLLFEPGLHGRVIEFSAFLRLHPQGTTWGKTFLDAVQGIHHLFGPFVLDGLCPGGFAEHINHRQQILHTLVPFAQFLHVDQI